MVMQPATKQRISYATWRVFPGGWLALGLGLIAATLSPFVTAGPRWTLPVLAVVCALLPAAYGLVEYMRGGRRKRDGPMEAIAHPGANVDLDRWFAWYRSQWWRARWRATAKREGWDLQWLHRRGRVDFVPEPPGTGWYDAGGDHPDVDEDREGIQTFGQHYPGQRRVVVYAPEAHGPVCHHELDLLAAHKIWPGQGEADDIERLKGLGVR